MKFQVCLYLLTVSLCAAGNILFVNQAVIGGDDDGSSWTNAFDDLQKALDTAVSGDVVWVAAGVYKPSVQVGGTEDRDKAFQMKNGVALYGGFAGTEPNDFNINLRDLAANETILSGETGLLGLYDNCYHVLYHPPGLALDDTAVLDGFTITAGNADGSGSSGAGGGMCNDSGSSPSLANCTFRRNHAVFGGGMYNNSSSPTLTNCSFLDNTGGLGGGMNNFSLSSPTVSGCFFVGNSANVGAGMENESASSPLVFNCDFIDNDAADSGGGMDNYFSSDPMVTHSRFIGNTAVYGGGMENDSNSDPVAVNCIFSGNTADYGGGMDNLSGSSAVVNCTFSGNSASVEGGGMSNYANSSPILTNCVLWGNKPDPIKNQNSTPVISYSDIAGCFSGGTWDTDLGTNGGGNKDDDPLFADADGFDETIGTADDNLRLLTGSPCIDAGDNAAVPVDSTTDLNGFDRFIDDICTTDTGSPASPLADMGACEYLRSDMDSDGAVGLQDFARLGANWSEIDCGDCAGADLTCDGNVDMADLWELTGNWLAGSGF